MAKKNRHHRQRSQPDEQPRAREQASGQGRGQGQQNAPINAREQERADEFGAFRGTPGSSLGPDNDSAIDEASAESFPASDPPAWSRNGL